MQQLDERLKGQYASLSPQEQRVADFIFDHFDDLISYNSAELAQLLHTLPQHQLLQLLQQQPLLLQ